MSDTSERPSSACILCPPPSTPTKSWRTAHAGYLTCDGCYDKLREHLKEIDTRYSILNPTPGASGEPGSRGAPGFGSRPAASPHIITMKDWRSKSCEASLDGVQYVWDPLADTVLEPGQYGPPAGAYVERREVWYGRDGRGHTEQEKPPRSVPFTLSSLAGLVAEERGITEPTSRLVPDLARWLDAQMDWITRNHVVVHLWDEFRVLASQLRPATGEPGRRHIGLCPNVLDDGFSTRECAARLFAPLRGDSIECGTCERVWPRSEWLRLGDLLEAS